MASGDAGVTVIGGGLAGCEAAWQLAEQGIKVDLYEMRPERKSPAHHSDRLAELVCSNSLGSHDTKSASALLKEELKLLGSKLLEIAYSCSVPAGAALAVDRHWSRCCSQCGSPCPGTRADCGITADNDRRVDPLHHLG